VTQSKIAANLCGIGSLACSLSFWLVLALRFVPAFPKSIDLSFSYWVAIWLIAVILALIAATLGSRRWALAALLPAVTLFLAIVLINLGEPW